MSEDRTRDWSRSHVVDGKEHRKSNKNDEPGLNFFQIKFQSKNKIEKGPTRFKNIAT